MSNYNVVQLAHEVIAMAEEIADLRHEITRLMRVEEQYNQLLGDSLEHSQRMVGNTIKMLLVPGVAEAFQKHGREQFHD